MLDRSRQFLSHDPCAQYLRLASKFDLRAVKLHSDATHTAPICRLSHMDSALPYLFGQLSQPGGILVFFESAGFGPKYQSPKYFQPSSFNSMKCLSTNRDNAPISS